MRRAALARTATLVPTKVEVEEAMQKAIFDLIKVGERLRCAEYVERCAGRAVKFLRLLLGGGGVDAEWMAPSDWFPKSQDFLAIADSSHWAKLNRETTSHEKRSVGCHL